VCVCVCVCDSRKNFSYVIQTSLFSIQPLIFPAHSFIYHRRCVASAVDSVVQ